MNFQYYENIRHIAKTAYFISDACLNKLSAWHIISYPHPPQLSENHAVITVSFPMSYLSFSVCRGHLFSLFFINTKK